MEKCQGGYVNKGFSYILSSDYFYPGLERFKMINYVPQNKQLCFYALINPSREIEIEADSVAITIKHHGEVVLEMCGKEARKLAKALEYAANVDEG